MRCKVPGLAAGTSSAHDKCSIFIIVFYFSLDEKCIIFTVL